MNAITFDTLKFTRRLKAGGFTVEQAETAAEAFAEAATDELATKHDIELLKRDIELLRRDLCQEIAGAESRITIRIGGMIAVAVAFLAMSDKFL